MELGIHTFGDITPDPNTGRAISIPQRYAEILAAAKLADDAGLDVFGVGEHHRLDIPISSPAAILSAIAGGRNGSVLAAPLQSSRPSTQSASFRTSRPWTSFLVAAPR